MIEEKPNMKKLLFASLATFLLVAGCSSSNEDQTKEDTNKEQEDGMGKDGSKNKENDKKNDEETKSEEDNMNKEDESNRKDNSTNNGSDEKAPTLTKEKAKETIEKAEEALYSILTPAIDSNSVPDGFESSEELVKEFEKSMTTSFAQDVVEWHFMTRDGQFQVRPTENLPWLEMDQPIELNKVSEDLYQVKQEHDSDMRGHIYKIYDIKYNGEEWMLDKITSEKIEE